MRTPAIKRAKQDLFLPLSAILAFFLILGGCDAGSFVEPEESASWQIQASAYSHVFTALEQTERFTASAQDKAGNPIPNAVFQWTSSDPAVATVAADGSVTAVGAGEATIEVTSGCCSGSDDILITVAQVPVSMSVSPAEAEVGIGDTLRLVTTALDANGHPIAGAEYTTSDSTVALVSSEGVLQGLGEGAVIASAKIKGKVAKSNIKVKGATTESPTEPTVAEVRASHDSHVFTAPDQTLQLSAQALDDSGEVVSGVSFDWSSTNTVRRHRELHRYRDRHDRRHRPDRRPRALLRRRGYRRVHRGGPDAGGRDRDGHGRCGAGHPLRYPTDRRNPALQLSVAPLPLQRLHAGSGERRGGADGPG